MKKLTFYTLLSCLCLMTACNPFIEEKIDIGAAPQADFSIEFIDPNNIKLTNISNDDTFIASWDLGSIGTASGDVVEINIPLKGDYEVTLTVFSQGGSGSITKTVTITQDDPNACTGAMEFLTNCNTKTWKLNPAPGALWVGPNDGSGNVWWQNDATIVTDRPCDWNDEYTFTEAGVYTYNSNGDLFGENYAGFSPDDCYPITDLSPDRAAWGDGTHAFQVIPGNPAKLKVIGNGAFVALRKAANGAEVTHPQSEVTYDIISMREEGGKDILELEIHYTTGIWRFTLIEQ